MGDYSMDEYEEYGDYEDEGGEYEDEGGEYEEEEEDRLPTQEELEYLELRQKLKESIRKKMKKKDPSSCLANLQEKKKKMPYDNFGSFFGPSQPVIAQRVIQESKSLLENPRLTETVLKAKNVQHRGGSSTQTISTPRPNGQQPRRVDNYAKPQAKIQMIKNTRDYSFLVDGAELPLPPKNPPKSAPSPKPDVHLSQRQQPTNIGRKVLNGREERSGCEERNGREERKPVPMSSQIRPKPGQQTQRPSISNRPTSTSSDPRKQVGRNEGSGPGRPSGQRPSTSNRPTSTSSDPRKQVGRNEGSGPGRPSGQRPSTSNRPTSTSSDPRKQVGRNEGSGPGRPSGQKPLPSKMSAANKQKIIPPSVSRNISMGHKPLPSRPSPSAQKRPLEPKRDERGSDKGDIIRKPVMPSKPQIKQPARPPPSSAQQKGRGQKRPARPFADEDDGDNAISMIRNMFGYNPNKYRNINDDDLSDMEAGFDDIMKEESRSAWIAAKEDEEEQRKNEEEERRERMRRKARKLGHR